MLAVVAGDLRAAVEAVCLALNDLWADPTGAEVLAAVDQAAETVAALASDPATQALQHLLTEIERCHRTGLSDSARLEMACRAAIVAVQIDPRWV